MSARKPQHDLPDAGPSQAPAAFDTAHLLERGYRPFFDLFSAAALGGTYCGSYQLRFADGIGTRYILVLHHGRHPCCEGCGRHGDFFSPESQMTVRGLRFNAEVLMRGQSLAEVEAFFLTLWLSMGLDYYEGPDGEACYPQRPDR